MRAGPRRLARIVALVSPIGAAGVALAAGISLATTGLAAGSAAAARCATGGLAVTQNLSGSSVVSVTIGNLPAACAGATLQAAVWNGSASSTGSGTVPAGGGSLTVALGAAVPVAVSEQTDIVITGP